MLFQSKFGENMDKNPNVWVKKLKSESWSWVIFKFNF